MFNGCSAASIQSEKLKDLDFTVVKEEDIPEQLKDEIEKKKGETYLSAFPFHASLSFQDFMHPYVFLQILSDIDCNHFLLL